MFQPAGIWGVCFGSMTTIAGFFGMNLPSGLEEADPRLFWLTCARPRKDPWWRLQGGSAVWTVFS